MSDAERLRRDRERKRTERAAARLSRHAGDPFHTWFAARVKELPESETAWASRLRDAMSEGVGYDRLLRKINAGDTQRARPDTVFHIGEGLRHVGIPWCSGPLALHAAGYLAEFYGFVATLAKDESQVRRALTIAYVTARASTDLPGPLPAQVVDSSPESSALMRALNEDEIWTARALIEAATSDASLMAKTWEAFQRGPTLRGAPGIFALAHGIITSRFSGIGALARERAALALIDSWVREDAWDSDWREAAKELRRYSPARTRREMIESIIRPRLDEQERPQ